MELNSSQPELNPNPSNTSNNEESAPDSQINPTTSLAYWNNCPATASGMLAMLGSYPWCTRIDLQGSKTFLAKVRRFFPSCPATGKLSRGVDCGAGVGRVSEGFLSQVCEAVDVVEPVQKFTDVLREAVRERGNGWLGSVYNVGLEEWMPQQKYDLIWVQWCVGHLTDGQLVRLFERCRGWLGDGGFVIVKENLSTDPEGRDMFDEVDSSVTRTDGKFRKIFEEAGMKVVLAQGQMGFPKTVRLLPVRMYALRPMS
ncbi:hypothetical protein AJ79_01624 [Helicocarpus griseus UAMH5409]|uniref:Alpha N-terminal protein methyltransferase 1 n=1 Tax=Helicocarpus griseus UAMH5409 TaxID=1447875 RepID=A0A2B7Y5Z8_9EURO|nr:hypothetical protein AJ79_01624 [Helicocarpus griseus UAMH5409]